MHWKSSIIILTVAFAFIGGINNGKSKQRKTTYQYGSLVIIHIDKESRSVWKDHNGNEIKGNDLAELCKNVGLSDNSGMNRFLNYLGTKGWQLVTIDWEKFDEGITHTYYFKRIKK